ncbi:MAG: bifunctional 2-polyprenyl-6-hydroxyphenol methylase/3-demethylubiquinol 3-O-methyltransferase UbiG [Alphaproteobacteria bacterium]
MAKFRAMAETWWDPDGQFKPLHRFNPVRIAYIRDRLAAHFGRDAGSPQPFAGLRLLDVGCGGGLLAEPMSRLGFAVTGVDALERNIQVARLHAEASGLAIDYRQATAEDLAARGEAFDVVLNMEVVEHVADRDLFMATTAALVRPGGTPGGAPGGAMIAATLNRTVKSLLLAKVGAEYVLRWLPAGTHDWRRFVKPSELAIGLRQGGMTVRDITGMTYHPIAGQWQASRDIDVNYMVFATRSAVGG